MSYHNRNSGTVTENTINARQTLNVGGVKLTSDGTILKVNGGLNVESLYVNGVSVSNNPVSNNVSNHILKGPPIIATDAEPISADPYVSTHYDAFFETSIVTNVINLNISQPNTTLIPHQYQTIYLAPRIVLNNMGLSLQFAPGVVLEFGTISFDLELPYLAAHPLPSSFIGKRTVGCESITNAEAIAGTWHMKTPTILSFEAELVPVNTGSIVFAETCFSWVSET